MGDLRQTVAIDFDGVIHAYRKGWHDGSIYDRPVEGAFSSIIALSNHYDIVVFTARDDLEPVREWLQAHLFEEYIKEVTNRKPKASVYLDDRAVRFDGRWANAVRDIQVAVGDSYWQGSKNG